MKDLPLSKLYQLLEPGPVVLLTTARKDRANVMTTATIPAGVLLVGPVS